MEVPDTNNFTRKKLLVDNDLVQFIIAGTKKHFCFALHPAFRSVKAKRKGKQDHEQIYNCTEIGRGRKGFDFYSSSEKF